MDNQTVSFTLIYLPLDDVAPEVLQSNSSLETPPHGKSVNTAQAKIDTTNKIISSANEQLQALPPKGVYAMSVQ